MNDSRKNKVLLIRTAHGEPKIDTYNVQQIGMGKALCKKGYSVDIIFNCKKEKPKQLVYTENGKEVNVVWIKGIEILRDAIFPSLLQNNALDEYDFILCNEYNQIMTYLLGRKHCGKNLYLYNGPYYNMFLIPFSDKLFDILFSKKINEAYKTKFTKSILATRYLEERKQDNIVTLGVGLDTEKFYVVVEDEKTKEIRNYLESNECLLYIGQFVKRKNFSFLIQVFKATHRIRPNIRLVMIGRGKEKYVKDSMSILTDEERSAVRIFSMISNDQMKFIYPHAKLFLLPSVLEIFGMVLLEAMYFGTSVIASENGGSMTCIRDGKNGYIIKGFNVQEWTNRIIYALDDNDSLHKIGNAAHETILTEYTWDALIAKILEKVDM